MFSSRTIEHLELLANFLLNSITILKRKFGFEGDLFTLVMDIDLLFVKCSS